MWFFVIHKVFSLKPKTFSLHIRLSEKDKENIKKVKEAIGFLSDSETVRALIREKAQELDNQAQSFTETNLNRNRRENNAKSQNSVR